MDPYEISCMAIDDIMDLYKISYEAIDNILKCLQELESQGQFTVTVENLIQALKFELRYARIHLKWERYDCPRLISRIRNWVQDVEMSFIQPTRNGSMAADLFEETLLRLLQNNHPIKAETRLQCSYYLYGDESCGRDLLIDELVMDWIDPLLENLKLLIHWNDLNWLVLPKEQIKDLEEKLISLRNFLEIAGKELETIYNGTPYQGLLHKTPEDLLARVKFLIGNAIYISYEIWTQARNFYMDKMLFDLLAKINHIEPEMRMIYVQFLKASKTANPGTLGIDLQALASVDSLLGNLEELLKVQDDGIPLDTNQLAFLDQELSFLRYFLLDPHLKQYTEPEQESFNSLLMKVEAMAREGALLTHCISDVQRKDDMAMEMNLVHSNLLEIVNLLKAKIRQMYQRVSKPSTSNFPRTPILGFLDFFIQNLEELLTHKADSIAFVKSEIETVESELALLGSFIKDTIKNAEKDENIARRILDVAYEAEQVIDLISASHFPRWYYILWLSEVIDKIKLLRKECTEVCGKKKCDLSVRNMEKASIHDRSLAYSLSPEEEFVGFNDEAEKIIDQLIRGPEELDVVSIVGMPGLGKTTLAKKVFGHPSVTGYFHLCSWYCVSQVYKRRELLLSILDNVTELTKKIREMDDEGLAEVLYRSLKGRRYFVVIDDIWSIEPWIDIHNSFPDDCNGSRILFTSRNRDVALQANPRSAPHNLRLFTDEESWQLLQKRVFQRRNCPPELDAIGEQIAKNCKGLPLSVVVIAGILKRMEESEAHWRQISESLGKHLVGDSRKGTDALELSYSHLPDYLKPCFLYFGVFPEDTEIPVWKLIRLWIAEGLVQKTGYESLENVAEGYLKELIARSLVMVAKNKSNGGVKSCRIHDLLHEFSSVKAEEENILLISKDFVKTEPYRQCCYWTEDRLFAWMPSNPYFRSVQFFPFETANSTHYGSMGDITVLPYILKLLRVLDLGRLTSCITFPHEIGFLVHLRYLAIRGPLNCVPTSVGNLWRLETFLFYGMMDEVKLPEVLFKMAHLKHVYVDKQAAFVLSDTFRPEESFESSIQKLSTPVFCHGDSTTEKVISCLKNLQKLKCIFLESWDSDRCCNRFPVLDSLSELESLNVSYDGIVKLPCELSFPSTLKKLTLSKFGLPWDEISMIGGIRQLEVLKLHFRAFEGRRWDVSDDEFCNLKVLKLESLDIVEWDASPDAFPCLELLVLQKCKQLEGVPSSFAELTTLQMIEVQWCSYSATKAVCEIQEEQQDLRPDGFKVIIKPLDWESALAS